jgi:hypothetical protein
MFLAISSAEMGLGGEIYRHSHPKSPRIQSIAGETGKD